MGKQCWSQAVLESGSWGHSVLQTPALVDFFYLTELNKDDSSHSSGACFHILVHCITEQVFIFWILYLPQIFEQRSLNK